MRRLRGLLRHCVFIATRSAQPTAQVVGGWVTGLLGGARSAEETLTVPTGLVEIHTYSTSTYYEAKNSSQFFWLAEWLCTKR